MFGLELQFRSRTVSPLGTREKPLPLSYQTESTHTKSVWDGERWGVKHRRGSITSLQRKGERSLVDGDEVQSFRESRVVLALCEVAVCYVAPKGLAAIGSFSADITGIYFFVKHTKKYRAVHGTEKRLHVKRQAFFLPSFLSSFFLSSFLPSLFHCFIASLLPDTNASYSWRSTVVSVCGVL